MLELKKCRDLLGEDCDLSDTELESLRNQVYWIADFLIDTHFQKIYLVLYMPYDWIVAEEFTTLCLVEQSQ